MPRLPALASLPLVQSPGSTVDQPPSTTRFAPVTYDDSSLARKSAQRATSSGRPGRPSGMWSAMREIGCSGSSKRCCVCGVTVIPGETVLTRIPWRAPSAASWRVSAITAPFDAVCAVRSSVSEPVIPAVEPTLTTLPPPRARRCGHACLHARNTRSSSLRIVNDQSSSVTSSSGAKLVRPALL